MHGIIFVSMSADIPSFETDVLLDTPDTLRATKASIHAAKKQFEALSDDLWSRGNITAVREELDGVEFTAWKQYGDISVAKVDDRALEHETIRYGTWLDRGVYVASVGDKSLYIYREREYIAPLPTSWSREAMLQPVHLQVIETRYSVYAMSSGEWAFAMRQGSGPVDPGNFESPVRLEPEFELYSGTTYRTQELMQKLVAFNASV